MKIYFMKQDALDFFKDNVESNLKEYGSKSCEWVLSKYENPFEEFKLKIQDFKLDMSSEKPEATDYNNVKIMYENLKDLSDSQATDERFWVGLSHTIFWDFLNYRCKIDKKEVTKEKILNNYFFKQGLKRSLIVNPLSRLWWVGRLIYDENATNPYYALEYLKVDFSTKVLSLFSSNYTNNPKIVRAVLVALDELEKECGKLERAKFLAIVKYVNMLGGVVVLDFLSQNELKEKIKKYYYEKIIVEKEM